MGRAIIGPNSITCFRGSSGPSKILAKMQSIVKDKMDNEWYCKYPKSFFNQLSDGVTIEVFDKEGKSTKKFFKGYLTFVKELDETNFIKQIEEVIKETTPVVKPKVKKEEKEEENGESEETSDLATVDEVKEMTNILDDEEE